MSTTTTTEQVRTIWSEVLGAPAAGQSFFDLGGDSLTALRLASRIEEETSVVVDIADIFDVDPTVEDLVGLVEGARHG